MYKFEGKRILLNNLYMKFRRLKRKGFSYSEIGRMTGYTRQYVRITLIKYKYQLD